MGLKGKIHKQSLTFRRKRNIEGKIFYRGDPKGLMQVAKERIDLGAKIPNLNSLKRDELIASLYKFKDFRNVKSKLFELIDKLNQELFDGEERVTAEFIPKYHCELAEIEMWWRNSKYTFRKANDRQWRTIADRVNKALDQFPVSFFAKLFRQVKAVEMAYSDGMETNELLKLKENNFTSLLINLSKKRKHHRSPPKLQKESCWTFITLNENTPRVTINI